MITIKKYKLYKVKYKVQKYKNQNYKFLGKNKFRECNKKINRYWI